MHFKFFLILSEYLVLVTQIWNALFLSRILDMTALLFFSASDQNRKIWHWEHRSACSGEAWLVESLQREGTSRNWFYQDCTGNSSLQIILSMPQAQLLSTDTAASESSLAIWSR